jgi:hypothetical protein
MHPDVVFVKHADGTSWLLQMSANTCRFDAESTELLESILAHGREASIRTMVEQFGVEESEIRADVADFISGLLKQQLIEPANGTSRNGHRAGRIISMALSWMDRKGRDPRRRAWRLLFVARLAVARFGWARTIEAWEQRYPQPARGGGATDAAVLDAIDTAVRETAARSLLSHECKERALACMALARDAGVEADLVIGLTYIPLAAHVWVECGQRIISDRPEHCRPYEKVARYGSRHAAAAQ